jgi:16S rRNA (guanine966-N2)-methyltransferase
MRKRGNVASKPRGSVRIIGGEWRSRRLAIAEGTTVRPTPDRVRETVFNWLRDHVAGARCLDLFAGTGVLGFEALSRGAAHVTFVERDPKLIEALNAQAATFGVRPRVVRQEAESFLHGVVTARFDVIFVDPPYEAPLEPILRLLPRWLAAGGPVYAERPREQGLPQVTGATWLKQSRAGAVDYGLLAFDAPAAGSA